MESAVRNRGPPRRRPGRSRWSAVTRLAPFAAIIRRKLAEAALTS